jgi:hypothetical protein
LSRIRDEIRKSAFAVLRRGKGSEQVLLAVRAWI